MSHPENDDSTPLTEALAGMGFSDPAGIAAAIERSSVGGPEAQAARASISDEAARAVVDRTKALGGGDPIRGALAAHFVTMRRYHDPLGPVREWACSCGLTFVGGPEHAAEHQAAVVRRALGAHDSTDYAVAFEAGDGICVVHSSQAAIEMAEAFRGSSRAVTRRRTRFPDLVQPWTDIAEDVQ